MVDGRVSVAIAVGIVVGLAALAVPATGRATVAGMGALPPKDCPWAPAGTNQSSVVVVSEVGLPAGTAWSYSLVANGTAVTVHSSTSRSSSGTLTVPSGQYLFNATNVTLGSTEYVPSPTIGCVVISGALVSIPLAFRAVALYALTFTEAGLPSGFAWGVSFHGGAGVRWAIGTNRSTISAFVPNGTYAYEVQNVTNTEQYFAPDPADGTVTVAGAAANVSVAYRIEATSPVTFTETGLPLGTLWCVGVTLGTEQAADCVPGASIAFEFPAGPVPYAIQNVSIGDALYVPTPRDGTIVGNGSAVGVAVVYTLVPTYSATFVGSGVPDDVVWNVIVAGPALGGGYTGEFTGATVVVDLLPPGAYTFSILAPTGYGADPASGSFSISSAGVVEAIAFAPTA